MSYTDTTPMSTILNKKIVQKADNNNIRINITEANEHRFDRDANWKNNNNIDTVEAYLNEYVDVSDELKALLSLNTHWNGKKTRNEVFTLLNKYLLRENLWNRQRISITPDGVPARDLRMLNFNKELFEMSGGSLPSDSGDCGVPYIQFLDWVAEKHMYPPTPSSKGLKYINSLPQNKCSTLVLNPPNICNIHYYVLGLHRFYKISEKFNKWLNKRGLHGGWSTHMPMESIILVIHNDESERLYAGASFTIELRTSPHICELFDLPPHAKLTNENFIDLINKHCIEIENEDEVEDVIVPKELSNCQVPLDNINLCFVGGVSTGKSTILNSIFCEELTQCKIKRTTMVPTIYIENDKAHIKPEEIYSIISDKNKEIIERTEAGEKISFDKYKELVFNVGKLDVNILEGSYVNVYDIPGLNDARTKDIYYKYLENNFKKFNLIVFIVDLHSGLNTSDEMEIVNFITNNTRDIKEQKNIYTLVVVNKADDMQLVDDELELTGELSEMYDQVEKTIKTEFERKGIENNLIGIVPLCAIDSYLYRMVEKHGDKFKLTPEQILKIGINEQGKRFSTKKPVDQAQIVYEKLGDKEFVNTMIQLSGFSKFVSLLHKFLNENGVSKHIRISNLLQQLEGLPMPKIQSPCSYSNTLCGSKQSLENLTSTIKRIKVYLSIEKIDKEQSKQLMRSLYDSIMIMLNNLWTKNQVSSVLDWFQSYKYLYDNLLNIYFTDFIETKYPKNLVEKLVAKICSELNTKSYSLKVFYTDIELIKELDIYTKETVNLLIKNILTNTRKERTITNDNDFNLEPLFEDFKRLGVNISKLLRFIIINHINTSNEPSANLFIKQMIYKKYNEIPIYLYITNKLHNSNIEFDYYVDGLSEDECDKPEHKLDIYYLKNYYLESITSK